MKENRLYNLERGLQRDKRRKRSKKLGRGEGRLGKEKSRCKCRREETDGMDRRKWKRRY
jgi:hypothetical protein